MTLTFHDGQTQKAMLLPAFEPLILTFTSLKFTLKPAQSAGDFAAYNETSAAYFTLNLITNARSLLVQIVTKKYLPTFLVLNRAINL